MYNNYIWVYCILDRHNISITIVMTALSGKPNFYELDNFNAVIPRILKLQQCRDWSDGTGKFLITGKFVQLKDKSYLF